MGFLRLKPEPLISIMSNCKSNRFGAPGWHGVRLRFIEPSNGVVKQQIYGRCRNT